MLREVSRPDNVRDDPLAPPHVSYGRETLKPPQVRARVAVGTMPCGRARVWAPGWRSGGPSTGRSRLGARPARAGARERAWGRQIARAHAFLNAVRLAGTEEPRQGSSGEGGGETTESPTASGRRHDDPRRGTLGLLAAHGGRVPRVCPAGRPQAPETAVPPARPLPRAQRGSSKRVVLAKSVPT